MSSVVKKRVKLYVPNMLRKPDRPTVLEPKSGAKTFFFKG
jgi:hypothetical protein